MLVKFCQDAMPDSREWPIESRYHYLDTAPQERCRGLTVCTSNPEVRFYIFYPFDYSQIALNINSTLMLDHERA
jgi:hypothetical protein